MIKIAVLVGSLRKESFSKKLANNIMKLFPENYEAEIVQIDQLPFYNQDFDDEGNVPDSYTTFREKMKSMDAVLFITPEYNRSVPAVLQNEIDVGSRPKSDNVWSKKPAAIIRQSSGNLSGFGANHHLRQPLVSLNMPVMQQPEAYIAHSAELFNENGDIENEGTVEFLQKIVNAFVKLIDRYKD